MGNVTIKFLAKELNLSIAAISKALRDSHEISPATKKRVQDLAKQLNYVPNPYASSLRHRKSKTIAVVLPEVADSFFSEAINGIEAVAIKKDYHVLLYLTHESIAREEAILKDFQSGRVDGILMSISAETNCYQHIHSLFSKDMPIVFFDRICNEIKTTKVITDDFDCGYNAAAHLIKTGCQKINFLSISESLGITTMRKMGCMKACQDFNMENAFQSLLLSNKETESNYSMIKSLLKKKSRPDGIIASVEKLSLDVYFACRELGLSIPDDLQLIGFSNLSSVSLLAPALTTITQPAFEIGETAASTLIKAIEKKSFVLVDEHITIPSKFIIRGSTKSIVQEKSPD
ncbi:MAG TPA: LacI family DNA-binding transcriptional regulator [Arachidicoccus sp.]|nr:LacI family DNA-binding transcriptional regulator [Arachidicoccus sp.]